MKSPLTISVGKIKETGNLTVDETVPESEFPDCLGNAGRLTGPLRVELDLFVKDGKIGVQGEVRGEWEMECGRCLAPVRTGYIAPVDSVLESSGSAVDAAEEVRQALVLAIPSKIVCRPDCKGLCPSCKNDRNKGDCGCKTGYN